MNRHQRRAAARRHRGRGSREAQPLGRLDDDDVFVAVGAPLTPGTCEVGLRCDLHAVLAGDPGTPCGRPLVVAIVWGPASGPLGEDPPHEACEEHALEELTATLGADPALLATVLGWFDGDRQGGVVIRTGPTDRRRH